MSERYAVLGSGAWGTTLAIHLASLGHDVRLYCGREATATELIRTRERPRLLPGIRVPEAIAITADPLSATHEVDHWIVAVPTAYLAATLEPFRAVPPPQRGIISLTKGIENGTLRRPSEIIREIVPNRSSAVLSGPSHAEEVAHGLPTSVVVAAEDSAYTQSIQDALGNDRFRIYTATDTVGVELAGALKNVFAIAAGVCDGLKFGDNAKSALLTRALVEMTRFGVAHGAEPATFAGLAGMGDLMATCFSPHGRNRSAGERLAKGESLQAILAGPKVIEGYFTARSVQERSTAMGLELPISRSVYELLYQGKPPLQAVRELMMRQQRTEVRE